MTEMNCTCKYQEYFIYNSIVCMIWMMNKKDVILLWADVIWKTTLPLLKHVLEKFRFSIFFKRSVHIYSLQVNKILQWQLLTLRVSDVIIIEA